MTRLRGDSTTNASDSGPGLHGAWNFRDVAATTTGESQELTAGLLFRSSTLSALTPDGGDFLRSLGVQVAVDLRSAYELAVHGVDAVPAGIEVLHRPFEPGMAADAPHVLPPMPDDDYRVSYMRRSYKAFAELEGVGAAISTVVDLLLETPARTVVVHCAAGKDRTGWVIAVVLLAAGVPMRAVATDYLESNRAVGTLRDFLVSHEAQADLSELLLGVRIDYLNAALAAVDEKYGSFAKYLDVVGLDDVRRRALRRVLAAKSH